MILSQLFVLVARVIDTTTVLLIFWARAVTDMRGQPMFSSLIEYRSDTQASFNLVAESITTTDAKVYDIKLKKGWKFHDGTEVKAKNFVDAWNWGAYAPNGQLTPTSSRRSRASTLLTGSRQGCWTTRSSR